MAITARTCFNPRTPCGVRPVTPGAIRRTYRFQSTHSLRSATRALRALSLLSTGFNPRTPCGVRPILYIIFEKGGKFQSTHSLRSATKNPLTLTYKKHVSIHALLAECDPIFLLWYLLLTSFNPRTPCGVRPLTAPLFALVFQFQSTHSLRSATMLDLFTPVKYRFQSTHSLRSATISVIIFII